MGGLTNPAVLLAVVALAAALVMAALYIYLRLRVRKLAVHVEEFLASDGEKLEYSVRESPVAPLHNAVAELENRLVLTREHLKAEGKRSSNLTADISHQLKTPLSSLKLFCEMDSGAHLEEELGQIERMERLIYSLLRLERLRAEGYEFHFARHSVEGLVRDAWQGLEPAYPNVRLVLEGEPYQLRCDAKWLGEAFLNLMKNACEHMEDGGELRVRFEQGRGVFRVIFEDQGGGVDMRDLPHLFERFYQAEGWESEGAGIGLSIVQAIVWQHNGTIRAVNIDNGLRMELSIPVLNLARG